METKTASPTRPAAAFSSDLNNGSRSAFEAYEKTAPYYDTFTAHHDTERWLENILVATGADTRSAGKLLDIACGTGTSFLPFLARDWQVTGIDISPAMLSRAEAKAPRRARLLEGDMTRLPTLGRFDLVTCFDDALNYVLDEVGLAAALAGIRRNLASDGLALFDLNTLHTYRSFFADTQVVDSKDGQVVWRGQSSSLAAPGSICEAVLRFEGSRSGHGAPAVHRQRHYGPEQITGAAHAAGLEITACFGHAEDAVLEQPLDETRHIKGIFSARLSPTR